jgi:hypothetical protein
VDIKRAVSLLCKKGNVNLSSKSFAPVHAAKAMAGLQLGRICNFFQPSPIAPPLPLEHIPVNLHWLNAARVVGLGTVHQIADRIIFQRVVGRSL